MLSDSTYHMKNKKTFVFHIKFSINFLYNKCKQCPFTSNNGFSVLPENV